MLETELLALVPDLKWQDLAYLFEYLSSHLFIKYQLGILTFVHAQVNSTDTLNSLPTTL